MIVRDARRQTDEIGPLRPVTSSTPGGAIAKPVSERDKLKVKA
jgi:hypothetical protein